MPRTSKPDAPLVARGTVIKLRRLCGKPNCRCADGRLHESWALSYSLEGRTRMVSLSKEVVPVARLAVKAYRKQAQRLEARLAGHSAPARHGRGGQAGADMTGWGAWQALLAAFMPVFNAPMSGIFLKVAGADLNIVRKFTLWEH